MPRSRTHPTVNHPGSTRPRPSLLTGWRTIAGKMESRGRVDPHEPSPSVSPCRAPSSPVSRKAPSTTCPRRSLPTCEDPIQRTRACGIRSTLGRGTGLRLEQLLSITPLWGSALDAGNADRLEPYFWGVHPSGRELEGLSEALDEVDGPGPRTEIDLLLRGTSNLVVIEAKNLSTLGRCGRHQRKVCPEVHLSAEHWLDRCRYWEVPAARFDRLLDFGARPGPGAATPPCAAALSAGTHRPGGGCAGAARRAALARLGARPAEPLAGSRTNLARLRRKRARPGLVAPAARGGVGSNPLCDLVSKLEAGPYCSVCQDWQAFVIRAGRTPPIAG